MLVWAQQLPKLTALEVPKDLVVGKELRLSCTVQLGDGPFDIVWYYNERPLELSPTITVLREGDFTSILYFKPLHEQHSGMYKCRANNTAGAASSSVDLIVNVAPYWAVEPSDLNIPVGSTAIAHCNARGSPPPKVTWTKHNGNEVSVISTTSQSTTSSSKYRVFGNGTVALRDVTKSDSGMYTCEVSNGIGVSLRKVIAVTVYHVPRAKALRQYVTALTGTTANLTCIATGDHPLEVIWMKDEQTIPPGNQLYDRIVVSHSGESEQVVSSLIMKQVESSDAGRYTCTAHNQYGKSHDAVRLSVQQPPQRPVAIEVSDVWSRSARVRWESPPGSSVTSYEVRYWSHRNDAVASETVHSAVTTSLIRNLHPATEYKVSVLAVNPAGTSELPSPVRFNTTEEEPSAAPVNVRIEQSGATYVLVTWSPPPENGWNGNLLGYYVGYSAAVETMPDTRKTVQYSYHTVSGHQNSFHLRGLVKGTTYKIVVKAFNAAGTGPPSSPELVTTLDGEYPPAPLISISSVDEGSVQLHWVFSNPVQQQVTGYTLHYRQEDQSWREVFVASGKQNSYLLSGLNPSVPCQVYLVAHSHFGNSEPSDIITVRFSSLGAPRFRSPASKESSELQEILYIVVPIVTVTVMVVVLVISVCFYLYIKKTRPPPPPVYADFPRDGDFMFATTGDTAVRHVKGTPYSTMQRSGDDEGIYESIVDMRTLSLRRKQANQDSLKKGPVDIVDVCVV